VDDAPWLRYAVQFLDYAQWRLQVLDDVVAPDFIKRGVKERIREGIEVEDVIDTRQRQSIGTRESGSFADAATEIQLRTAHPGIG